MAIEDSSVGLWNQRDGGTVFFDRIVWVCYGVLQGFFYFDAYKGIVDEHLYELLSRCSLTSDYTYLPSKFAVKIYL